MLDQVLHVIDDSIPGREIVSHRGSDDVMFNESVDHDRGLGRPPAVNSGLTDACRFGDRLYRDGLQGLLFEQLECGSQNEQPGGFVSGSSSRFRPLDFGNLRIHGLTLGDP